MARSCPTGVAQHADFEIRRNPKRGLLSQIMQIRPATKTDLIFCEKLAEIPELALSTGDFLKSDYLEKYLDEKLFLVGEISSGIVGFIYGEMIKDSGCIVWAIAVRNDLRGSGIGSSLLSQLERNLISIGGEWVIVYGARDNENTLKFYQSHGFRKGISCVEFVKEFPT